MGLRLSGSHKNLRKKFHDFSMNFPCQNQISDTKYQHKLREYTFLWLIYQFIASITNICIDINSYPLFASMDTGIYPSAALQYPVWPKAKCGIAMLRIHGSKEGVNELIACSNNVAHILKHLRSFKTTATVSLLSGPKSSYKHSVTRSHCSSKGNWMVVVITIVISLITFNSLYSSRWWHQAWNPCLYFMVVSQSEARIWAELR